MLAVNSEQETRLCQPNLPRSKRLPVPRSPPSVARRRVSELKGASKSMYELMTEKQLDEFASTKRKGKPEHVAKKK